MTGRQVARTLLALLFGGSGVLHLVHPEPFRRIVPPYFPAPSILVAVSGVAEIAGALGLIVPKLRRPAAVGLVALLVAVFPANVQMATHPDQSPIHIPTWLLYLRLPLQPVLIALVWWVRKERPS